MLMTLKSYYILQYNLWIVNIVFVLFTPNRRGGLLFRRLLLLTDFGCSLLSLTMEPCSQKHNTVDFSRKQSIRPGSAMRSTNDPVSQQSTVAPLSRLALKWAYYASENRGGESHAEKG